MRFIPTSIKGVILIEPETFGDRRGFFMETYRRDLFRQNGMDVEFVQWNHSLSVKNTLRGMHYQAEKPQGKLVRVVRGEVYDVAVDIRFGSPTFGGWIAKVLSAENKKQLFVPAGFAHGFCVLSETAEFIYACTAYYHPQGEKGVIWNDPDLNIPWPVKNPLLSEKDKRYPQLKDIGRDFVYQQNISPPAPLETQSARR
ncbi:MAG: dTDP-4-dehydrorhamnose 3,5-epimerase [Kiritimatiellae bacterium]|nr:dTDP-4-dehydrorhamnose 3,5-epimerase [Kiritimatiellia bacterium]